MRSVGQFQAGNFKGSGKSRVMWFPSVAAARAEPKLFELADAIEIDGQSLFYADRLSAVVDDGTPNTDAIKLTAVQFGRFVRAQPYLPSGVYLYPTEDGSDDWVRLNALAAVEFGAGGLGRRIILMPGNWRMVAHAEWPIGTKIEAFGPTVHIVCDVPAPSTAPPYRGPFVVGPRSVAVPNATTLAANVAIEATTVSLNCARLPVAGEILVLVNPSPNFQVSGFEIGPNSVSGVGPYTVVLDYPCPYAFTTASSSAEFWDANRGYEFIGNGATVSGVAERATSIACAWGCKITGWNVDSSQFTEYACSLDTAGGLSVFDDMHVVGVTAAGAMGIVLEYSHGHTIKNSSSQGHGTMMGCWGSDHTIENVDIVGTNVAGELGILVGHGRGHKVARARVSNCYSGVDFRSTRKAKLADSTISGCAIGIGVNGVIANPSDAVLDNVSVTLSVEGCVRQSAYSTLTLNNCNIRRSDNQYMMLLGAGSVTDIVGGVYTIENNYTGVSCAGALSITGEALFDCSSIAANGLPIMCNGGTLKINGIKFIPSASVQGLVAGAGGFVSVENVSILAGVAAPVGCLVNTPCVLYRGTRANFAGCTTPFSGTGPRNFGVTNLNGAAAVSLPYPLAIASSVVTATRRAFAGTPGHFSAIAAAGVGGTLTGQALDTSTIEWRID